MSPRLIVTKKDILRLRAMYWERHYGYRSQVRAFVAAGRNGETVTNILRQSMALPSVNFDGSLADLNRDDRRSRLALVEQLEIFNLDLLCVFWWSEAGWMEYVRQYQALVDPVEDWYWTYHAPTDQMLLVPMSSKAVRGQVIPKYFSGNSRGVLPENAEIPRDWRCKS